jgi:mono/diheme cytochrome c family protein
MKRFILGAVFALAIVAVGVYMLTREQPQAPSMGVTGEQSQVIRGEYLARVGDCYACHTLRGGAPYAGGLEMATPFGSLYTTNITPDPDTGIGKWTADDFWAALHDGKSKDGSFLYPAMPYTNYTKVTREDSDAMYAYFRTVKPARLANRPPALGFPYNQRQLMLGWRTLYFKPGVYQDNPKQSKEWNRGAYLVEGLGHCNACHSARNALGAVSADDQYAGGLIPVQNWYAPSLTSEPRNRPRWMGHQGDRRTAADRRFHARRRLRADVGRRAAQPPGNVVERPDRDGDLPEIHRADRRTARGAASEDDRRADRRNARSRRQALRETLRGLSPAQRRGRTARLSAAREQSIDCDGASDQRDPHRAQRWISAKHRRQSASLRNAAFRV